MYPVTSVMYTHFTPVAYGVLACLGAFLAVMVYRSR